MLRRDLKVLIDLRQDGLDGDKKYTLEELQEIIQKLIDKYGKECIIGFDAGYNNVSVYLSKQ